MLWKGFVQVPAPKVLSWISSCTSVFHVVEKKKYIYIYIYMNEIHDLPAGKPIRIILENDQK